MLQRYEIPAVAGRAWFPEISVGSASCYLRDAFRDEVYLAGESDKDVLVVLVKRGGNWRDSFSCERDRNTLALYARLGATPGHRGVGLSRAFPLLPQDWACHRME